MKNIEIFVSYAHEDEALQMQLVKHLRGWERQGVVRIWNDRDISAGTEWKRAIDEHLATAQIILLLVSPDFINSDYCNSVEVRRAIERHERGEAHVIPIILRPVHWQDAPFGELQALPKDAQPVTRWKKHEDAFFDIARGLKKVVEELNANGEDALHVAKNNPMMDITLYEEDCRDFDDDQSYSTSSTKEQSSIGKITDVKVINSVDRLHLSLSLAEEFIADYILTYSYERIGDTIIVKPEMPYLSKLSRGDPILGADMLHPPFSPFRWHFPKLSIKLVNISNETLFLSEALVKVKASKIHMEPLLVVDRLYFSDYLVFRNEGWGNVIDPVIKFRFTKMPSQSSQITMSERTSKEYMIRLETFSESIRIPIEQYISESGFIEKIHGSMQYSTEMSEKRFIKFETESDTSYAAATRLPTYLYDVYLQAGRSDYTQYIPLAQEVKSGDADHFLIQVASDKSAQFSLTFSFRAVGGREIQSNEVVLDVFVPRSSKRWVSRFSKKKRNHLSEEEIE